MRTTAYCRTRGRPIGLFALPDEHVEETMAELTQSWANSPGSTGADARGVQP